MIKISLAFAHIFCINFNQKKANKSTTKIKRS